jgi:hypothetical protein
MVANQTRAIAPLPAPWGRMGVYITYFKIIGE